MIKLINHKLVNKTNILNKRLIQKNLKKKKMITYKI